jgi:hypothetical protein
MIWKRKNAAIDDTIRKTPQNGLPLAAPITPRISPEKQTGIEIMIMDKPIPGTNAKTKPRIRTTHPAMIAEVFGCCTVTLYAGCTRIGVGLFSCGIFWIG